MATRIIATYRITYANGIVQQKDLVEEAQYGENRFTVGSPLYNAIWTGYVVLPEHQGGLHKVKMELLQKHSELSMEQVWKDLEMIQAFRTEYGHLTNLY